MVFSLLPQNGLEVQNIKKQLREISGIPELQNRIDQKEKEKRPRFEDFTDLEMLAWYVNERKHLNEENDRSKRTVREYERELILFVEQLINNSSEIDLDIDYIIEGSLFKSLQERHIRRYQEWLKTKSPHVLAKGPYSWATLERKTTILRSFFAFLKKVGYIHEPLADGLKISTTRSDDRPNRDLGPADVVKLLDTFRDMQHPIMFSIIHVLTTTGIRNEEFCILRIEDLKKDSIQGGWYLDITGKGNKKRQVPLKDKTLNSIRMHRHARGLSPIEEALSEEPLFTTNTGKAYTPSYLSQYVSKQVGTLEESVLGKGTPKITPHVFRHAFAIISKISGTELHDIMLSLGHTKIDTTMIYLEKQLAKERHAIHNWKADVLGDYI